MRDFSVTITEDGCWRSPYKGSKKDGRVRVSYEGKQVFLYRLVFAALRHEPQETLHHTCRNPWCINPWHLEEVSQSDHMKNHHLNNPILHKRSHCKNGHLLSDAGQDHTGWCMVCKKDYMRKYYQDHKEVISCP